MSSFSSQYKGLNAPPTDNEDEDYPPQFTTLLHEQEKSRWSHIDDLDEFFTRVYQYHQNHGMPSLVLIELLKLFQIVFLAFFSVFMLECVDYESLFQNQKVINDKTNNTIVKKTTIVDVVYPLGKCVLRISFQMWLILFIVLIFWLFRLIKAIYNIARYAEIRSFYITALNIQTKDLPNITWHEVQEKLLLMQKKHHLCVHKQELTELDIYNRILRFKNYQVAMVNQALLPPKVDVPIFGPLIFFTSGFKYNFEFLFFWGPFAPFTNCYQLRPEFKINSKREELASELSKSIMVLGIMNLVLSPVIFIWQLLQFLYNYTELIKRDPGVLGTRRWSNYGKLYFRHFNELDHELDARLSRAYKPAILYLSSFVSKFLVVVAKFFLFTFGAIFAVLIVLTIYDEDVLNVEHVLTVISITGAVAGIARSLIPDENTVYFMDQMMYQILAQVHYMPDSWVTHANSYLVRDEFVKLFQYKFVYFIEELLSPIITPLILLFWLKPRAGKVVDFLRNFTVDVVGVGDVCSFAQMDTHRHGNPKWLSRTSTKKSYQARNGKTELSLIHFAHTNPNWKMPSESLAFIDQLRDQAVKETINGEKISPLLNKINENSTSSSLINNNRNDLDENSLNRSLYHLQSLVYNSVLPSNLLKSNPALQNQQQFDLQLQQQQQQSQLQQQSYGQLSRGGISRIEGPLYSNKQERQTLLTIAQASALQLSTQTLLPMPTPGITTALENSLDMCFSALYMHELHRKYHHGDYIDLDNVKEENDETTINDNQSYNNTVPLYKKSSSGSSQSKQKYKKLINNNNPNETDEEEEDDEDERDSNINESDTNDDHNNNNGFHHHTKSNATNLYLTDLKQPATTTLKLDI